MKANVLTLPAEFTTAYTDADRELVAEVMAWLNRDDAHTHAELARLSRLPASTISSVLAGKYPSSPSRQLTALAGVCRTAAARAAVVATVPFVETSTYRLAFNACHRARLYRNFGVLPGAVGTGKTRALREYARITPGTFLIEGVPDMTPSLLLSALLAATGASAGSSSPGERLIALIHALRGTDSLLILDEAEKVKPACLEHLRRLRDQAGVGVVLAGTDELIAMLNKEAGQFGQVRSRVGFWPQTIRAITRDDCEALVAAGFPDYAIGADVLEACWTVCAGSVRVLVESLIPAVHDYGLAKGHELSAQLVRQVATTVLGLKVRA